MPTLVGYGPTEAPPSRRRTVAGHRDRTPAEPAQAARPLRRPLCASWRANADRPGRRHRPWPGRHHHTGRLGRARGGRTSAGGGRRRRRSESHGLPVRGIQKHMAEAMVRSVATAPQACVFLTLDVTPTVRLVEQLRAHPALRGGAADRAVRGGPGDGAGPAQHPSLNCPGTTPSAEIVTKHYVNLGVAVAGPSGLLVPTSRTRRTVTARPCRCPGRPRGTSPRRTMHARRPQRRDDHRHQRRRLRRRRRRAHPQPGEAAIIAVVRCGSDPGSSRARSSYETSPS